MGGWGRGWAVEGVWSTCGNDCLITADMYKCYCLEDRWWLEGAALRRWNDWMREKSRQLIRGGEEHDREKYHGGSASSLAPSVSDTKVFQVQRLPIIPGSFQMQFAPRLQTRQSSLSPVVRHFSQWADRLNTCFKGIVWQFGKWAYPRSYRVGWKQWSNSCVSTLNLTTQSVAG